MNILVTGGAGFIGSNLVEALLQDERVSRVRVLDNFATGKQRNITAFSKDPKFELLEGDIRDYQTCLKACDGIDRITHQAALGSVPRSIKDPLTTNAVNISGTLNIFTAAKEKQVDRIVYAASSSTYGDSKTLPKVEGQIGKPLSPYAITKYVNELYADVFHQLYGTDFVGLRYFNIFGPKQDPHGAYAAVIPLFFAKAIRHEPPTINGDGSFSRDFTYVANAVQANIRSLFTKKQEALNQVYNIAVGERTTLLELWTSIKSITKTPVDVIHGPERKGDVPHSLADITKARKLLYYQDIVPLEEGLARAFKWYEQQRVDEKNVAAS